jgi:hypothetical protein
LKIIKPNLTKKLSNYKNEIDKQFQLRKRKRKTRNNNRKNDDQIDIKIKCQWIKLKKKTNLINDSIPDILQL